MEAECIIWSGEEYSLGDFLRTFSLPQIVKVVEGFYDAEENRTFGQSQLLTLHKIRNIKTVRASDDNNHELILPIDTTAKVEIVWDKYREFYESVEELAEYFPTFVRVVHSHPWLKLESGDVLRLRKKVKRRNGLHLQCEFVNKKKNVEIPLNYKATFKTLGDCELEVLTLEQVIKHCELPCVVRFIDRKLKLTTEDLNAGRPFGINVLRNLTLHTVSEFSVVFTTTWEDTASTVLPIPLNLEINVVAALGAITNDSSYSKFCKVVHDRTKSEELVLKYVKHGGCTVLLEDALEEIHKTFKPPEYLEIGPRLPPRETRNPEAVSRMFTKPSPNAHPKPVPPGVHGKEDSTALLSQGSQEGYDSVKTSSKCRSISVNLPPEHDLYTHSSSAASFGEETKNKKLSPLPPNPVTSKNTTKKPHKSIKELFKRRTISLSASSSSKMSVNYAEVERLPPEFAADRLNVEISKDLKIRNPGDLSTWTVVEVSECLRYCRLEEYAERFKEEQIDGSLLADLDEESLIELGVTERLHIRKLLKIINDGWWPKT